MLDLTTETTHEDLLRTFQWRLPERFNIAEAVCGRHAVATPERPAVITVDEDGRQTTVSYGTLDQEVRCVTRGLRELGVVPGDRVAIRLDQGVPALTAVLGAIRLGAIAVPIPPAFSGDAVVFRLRDCRVKVLVTDALRTEEAEVVEAVIVSGEASVFPGGEAETGAAAQTSPDDPALLFYTSGSTGPPKGVLHGQRVLLGHVPGFQLMFDGAPEEGDVFWTPSVWAWQGSLGDLVLPALYFGCAVVATPGRYSSERAYQILSEAGITRAFLATAVLRRLASEPPAEPPRTTLRSICTGGDPLPPGFRDMVRDVFGVRVNDDYGLTETSHIAVGCSVLYDTPEGAIGRIVPGRQVAIVDDALQPVPVGIEGQIVSAADDPITMLEYWERPEATARRIVDGWCLTGDRGCIDADGFLWYRGRMGLAMKVAGQVIGPEELEAVLLSHPAVAEVCVFAEPDPVLRDRPAAIVELVSGHRESPELVTALQDLARAHLARFAYPRRVLFEPIVRHPNGKTDRRGTAARYRES